MKIRVCAFLALAIGLIAVASNKILACTAFQLRSVDGAQIYFRSMEFGFPFDSKALIIPRGTKYVGTAPGGKPGLSWITKYGVVGLNVNIAPSIVADGMNEKGLVVGMLYLPGFAKYQSPDEKRISETIGSWEVANLLLSTCVNIDEAIDTLSHKAYVAEQNFKPFGQPLPVHFWIGDASGKVVIAEYVGGKLNIHKNELGTLTNSPPFDWHQINLSNFVNLTPVNVPSRKLGNVETVNYGQGSGFIGLPGDLTPPSRFVRASLFSQWATPAKNAVETVNLGFHILNTFDIFNGAIQSNTSNQTENTKGFLKNDNAAKIVSTDTTEWIVSHDRTNLKTYVRTYAGLEIQMIDLNKIDFDQPGLRTINLKNEFTPKDITGQANPLK